MQGASSEAVASDGPLLQRLRSAVGDAPRIVELVCEAERTCEDLQGLAEAYGVAVEVYGSAQSTQDYAYRDLCVKRMRVLCRLSPSEAREFHNRLRTYTVGRADARMYEARAAMEERLGDTTKAVKMLQEGLRVGAQPSEVLQRVLRRIQESPEEEELLRAAAEPCSRGTDVVAAEGAPPLAAPCGQAGGAVSSSTPGTLAGPRLSDGPAAQPREVGRLAASFGPATMPAAGQPTVLAGTGPAAASRAPLKAPGAAQLPPTAAAPPARARTPRILGLGSPTRNCADRGSAEADEEEEEEEVERCGDIIEAGPSSGESLARVPLPARSPRAAGAGLRVDFESFTAASMSVMPLSPIREVDSSVDATSVASRSRKGSTPCPCPPVTPGGASSRPSDRGAATAAAVPSSPQTGTSGQDTPRHQEASAESVSLAAAAESLAAAAQGRSDAAGPTAANSEVAIRAAPKLICVNGVTYTQLQTIGRGGSSKVYLVQSPTGAVFALKRVVTDNASQLEAFQNEVTLLQQLRCQEHVIQVVDAEVDREKGRINIIMEAGDMDLGRFLQSAPKLSLSQIQQLWRQMLEAVQVIHSERIVHSDLKPGNFLLVGGRLKVIDFGIAKRISNDTTNISRDASIGTLSYMAPEAVKQGQLKLGRASDIWSLGIILYQMVYEHPPFAHMEPMQRLLKLSDPALTIQLPPGHRFETHSAATKAQLTEVLSGCLQRDPRRRPSLPELLAHPFACTEAKVQREVVAAAVGSLMGSVLRVAAAALHVGERDAELLACESDEWKVLTDEVWERLAGCSSGAGGGESKGLEQQQQQQPPAPTSTAGLAPFEERLRAWLEAAAARDQVRTARVQTQAGQCRAARLQVQDKENIMQQRPLNSKAAAGKVLTSGSRMDQRGATALARRCI